MKTSVAQLVCAVATLSVACQAVIYSGTLTTGDSYRLIGRFAFNKAPEGSAVENRITVTLENPSLYENLVVGLYYQNWETWNQYTAESTCIEKISFATKLVCTTESVDQCPTLPVDEDGESIVFQPDAWAATASLKDGVSVTEGGSDFDFSNNYEVEWFWVVLANCNVRACSGFGTLCDAPLMNVTYSLAFENAVDPDNAAAGYTHLGADDRPLLIVLIASAVAEALVCVFGVMVMCWLKNHEDGNFLHHTVKILFASICFTMLGSVAYAIHLGVLGVDGTGVVALSYVGYICYAIGTTTLLAEIIVIAKGWTIVRRKISAGGRMKIAAFLTMFFVVFLTCIFWAELNQDLTTEITIFESGPGIVLVALRFLAALWFILAAINTARRFEKKKRFFIKFFIFAGLWIFSMPVICLIAYALVEWVRKVTIFAVVLFFDVIAHASFAVMFNPKGAVAASFPFHATLKSTLEQKRKSSREIANVAKGEVGGEALNRMKTLTDKLLEQFSSLEVVMKELEAAAVQMKEVDDEEDKDFNEEEAEDADKEFSSVADAHGL